MPCCVESIRRQVKMEAIVQTGAGARWDGNAITTTQQCVRAGTALVMAIRVWLLQRYGVTSRDRLLSNSTLFDL
jgi:hypothetical protein